ncbi:MAG TPA: hypothetical protein VFX28_11470, partial [Methylomirabilota bacterium]|nr:hypothetical protein [Methylomirabilota bacterium]
QAWFGWLLLRAGLSVAQVWMVSYGGRGLVGAVESGDVHVAVVPEPHASRLLADGRATLLADLRTPAAVSRTLGAPTLNAAVFTRADRPPAEAALTAFARALLAAERLLGGAPAPVVAARLPARVTAPGDEFRARLEAGRRLYLADGLVTAAQMQETLALIRANLPLSQRLPSPEQMLHTGPLHRALSPPPPR